MQELIVALIVAFATWTVAKRYLPQAVRTATRAWSARTARRMRWHGLAQRLESAPGATQGCGTDSGCNTCGNCGTPAGQSSDRKQISIRKI